MGFQILSLALLVGLAFLPNQHRSQEDLQLKARSQAEILAYQVVQLYRDNQGSSERNLDSSRSPASVLSRGASEGSRALPISEGLMGRDPWGQAFAYRIQSSESSEGLIVEVSSYGPDFSPGGQDDVVLRLSF